MNTLTEISTSALRSELLRRNALRPPHPNATLALQLIERAGECYGLTPAQVMSKRRDTVRCHVRWSVITALTLSGWSSARVASVMDCDRGTVENALHRVGMLVETDHTLLATIMMLRATIRQALPIQSTK